MSHTSHHPKDCFFFRTPNQICVALSAFFPHPILCGINNALLASTRSYFQMVTNSFVARDLWLFAPQTHQTIYIYIHHIEWTDFLVEYFSLTTSRKTHIKRGRVRLQSPLDDIYICMNTRIPATLEGLSLSLSRAHLIWALCGFVFGFRRSELRRDVCCDNYGSFVPLKMHRDDSHGGFSLTTQPAETAEHNIYFICFLRVFAAQ